MNLDLAIILYLLAGVTIAGQSWSFENLRRKYDLTVKKSPPRYYVLMALCWTGVPLVWCVTLAVKWLEQLNDLPPPNGGT